MPTVITLAKINSVCILPCQTKWWLLTSNKETLTFSYTSVLKKLLQIKKLYEGRIKIIYEE